MASSASLLHWVRAMLQVRSRHKVFGLGDFEVCPSDNDGVLSYLRVNRGRDTAPGEASVVLCINNLTSRPQASTVRVPEEYAGAQSLDLFGGSGFPKVSDDGTLSLTLGSRDFFWLQLQTGAARG